MTRARRRSGAVRPPLLCWFALVAIGWAGPGFAQEGEVSLAEILSFAEQHAPGVQVSARRQGYGAAARAGAEPLLPSNPTLELGLGPRLGAGSGPGFDFVASLGQPLEVAGERGLRLDAAQRQAERVNAEAAAVRWAVRREVILAYHTAAVSREQVALHERFVRFAEEMLALTRRRLAAGDASAIDVRIAETEHARARQAKLAAERDLRVARLGLAEVTGWSLDAPPNAVARLDGPRPVPGLAQTMETARDRHPELVARRAATREAHARSLLADREAWPEPVVGVQVSHEGSPGDSTSWIVLGTIGVPLPLWQLNQGERAQARVDEEVAGAGEAAAARSLLSRIARAHAEVSSAAERLAIYTSSVAPSLEDSLSLLRRGFDAGELPILTLAVARERLLQSQRDALGAYADYYRALADLELAMGTELPAPRSTGGSP